MPIYISIFISTPDLINPVLSEMLSSGRPDEIKQKQKQTNK